MKSKTPESNTLFDQIRSHFRMIIPPSSRPLARPEELRDDPEQLLRYMHSLLEELEGRRDGFENFPTLAERKEVVEISNKLVTYLHDNRITNLVLIDRSARPVYIGVKKLWKKKFPDDPNPNIYFVNPNGLLTVQDVLEMGPSGLPRIMELVLTSKDKEDNIGEMTSLDGRTPEEIQTEFEEKYKKLYADKEKPVLIFDNCIHHGRAFYPVRELFEKSGFSDVRFGVSSDERNYTHVQPDLVCLNRTPLGICYPFHRDSIVDKQMGSIVSVPTIDNLRREKAIRTRKELVRIFDEAPKNWYL